MSWDDATGDDEWDDWTVECSGCGNVLAECSCPREDDD